VTVIGADALGRRRLDSGPFERAKGAFELRTSNFELRKAYRLPSASTTARPMSAGLFTTRTPAAVSAAIFSAAVPLPPEMIAPAWPMRRPGGAV
jgi:hypothetical protein